MSASPVNGFAARNFIVNYEIEAMHSDPVAAVQNTFTTWGSSAASLSGG